VLFRSDDGGETWVPNLGILEHPTRDRWLPGAAGICCHSIQLDPSDPQRMYVGITSAGTFRTDDGGATWIPLNKNVAADFLPDPSVEVGRTQAASPPGPAGTALAAEPLRCLSVRQPR
jgi:hypothetical protein